MPRQKNKNKKNKTIELSESSDDDEQEELVAESEDKGVDVVGDDDYEDEVSEDPVDVEELLDSNDEGDVTDSFESIMDVPQSPTVYAPVNKSTDEEESD